MAKSSAPGPTIRLAPKGEKPAVTIAMQKRQIDDLVRRCMDLAKERDQVQKELASMVNMFANSAIEIEAHRSAKRDLRADLDACREAYTRLRGWQDCARELINSLAISTP